MARISAILLSVVIGGMVLFALSQNLIVTMQAYGATVDPYYQDIFNNITNNVEESETLANTFSQTVEEGTTTTTDTGLSLQTSSIWTVVKSPFTVDENYLEFITQTGKVIPIPKKVISFIYAIIGFMIIFAVVRPILRAVA